MRQYADYLLPDAGKIFIYNNMMTFKVPVDADFEEVIINMDNIEINGDFAFVDKKFAVKGTNYRDLKTNLVKKVFSNDDQIAIILNKDKAVTTFMNEWRTWFGNCGKKIMQEREK